MEWFEKVHDYTWEHFKDKEYPGMVWLLEPKRRSIATTQRRKMERMLPCAKRTVSVLENIRRNKKYSILISSKFNIMRKILFLILMLSSVSIQAQNLIVKGVVSDESDVLPGVSIFVEGTSKGTISDINGKYSIEVKKGSKLVFSYVGYRTEELVANTSVLNVKMKTDAIQLEEAIVVGYAKQKKATLTGAVSSVSSETINKKKRSILIYCFTRCHARCDYSANFR